MQMHKVIKQRRTLLGLTQENIATQLGVSAPAVNKWEKGVTYPDIGTLSSLAKLLKIDMNTLLCFKNDLSMEEIGEKLNEIAAMRMEKSYDAAFQYVMSNCKEYPDSDLFVLHATIQIDNVQNTETLNEAYCTQIKRNYESVLYSANKQVAHQSAYMLTKHAMQENNFKLANLYLDKIPEELPVDKHTLQVALCKKQLEYDKAIQLTQEKLFSLVTRVQSLLMELIKIHLHANDGVKASEVNELQKSFCTTIHVWKYLFYLGDLCLVANQKDATRCVKLIKEMVCAIQNEGELTGPLYSHLVKKECTQEGRDAFAKMIAHSLQEDETFSFLKNNEEYNEWMQSIR